MMYYTSSLWFNKMEDLSALINYIQDFKITLKKSQARPIELFWMSITYFLNSGNEIFRVSYVTNDELIKIRSLVRILKDKKTSLKYFGVNFLERKIHLDSFANITNSIRLPYYTIRPLFLIYPISNEFYYMFEDEMLHCIGESKTYDTRWKIRENL